MTNNSTLPDHSKLPDPLRRAAEAQWAATPSTRIRPATKDFLVELQVHQIELEMQNEALRQTQIALEESRNRYIDLYEFAPVGYLTVSANGIITDINLTGTKLLGEERKRLTQRSFANWVADQDRQRWQRLFIDALGHLEPQSCELLLQRGDGSQFYAELCCLRPTTAVDGASASRTVLRMVLTDISQRQQAVAALQAADALKHAILSSVNAQIAVLDGDGVIVEVNEAWRRFALENSPQPGQAAKHTGIGVNYLTVCQSSPGAAGEDVCEKGEEGGGGAARAGILSVLEGRLPSFRLDYPCHSPNQQRWFSMSVTPLDLNQAGVVITHNDITATKQADAELRIAAIAFESQEGMIVTDAQGVILRVNQAFSRLSGYSAEEAIGQTPALLSSGRHDRGFYQRMWQLLRDKGFWQGEMWNRRKNGKIYAEWLTISAVHSATGANTHYVGTFSEITQNKEAEAEIHRLAYYDALTQLPNRRLLHDRISQALAGSLRSGRFGALLFLDLDNFKNLNDTRGHDVGDQLLIETARRILSQVREGDSVARLGGDEFVVLLEDLSPEAQESAVQAGLVGEKIRQALALPFVLGTVEFHCTVSIGAAVLRGHDESVDTVLKHADLALYKAKNAGRNTLRFFDPAMQTALDERSAVEADLRLALERGELQLYYQAQIVTERVSEDDSERRIIGAEALLRWMHPLRGLVSPLDFIPLAEESGLILPIGHWVLATACAQLKAWSTAPATRDLRLAVNVSARQFRQPEFVAQVMQVLEESGANPQRLKIELTESIVIDNVAETIARMQALKAIGVGFSMDDFGTGFSSLSYLKRLPLDQLKIDRAFVQDLASDPSDAAIVHTIIRMGQTLGLDVIAEGVESEAQLEILRQYGCTAYQGYLFARPLPLAGFEALLGSEPGG
jgi:diguanylate cyclase (GGDEF)-like protein/PAS domain S-box-containing protein